MTTLKSTNSKQLLQRYGRIITLAIIVLIAVAVATVVHARTTSGRPFSVLPACEILSEDIARKVGGSNLTLTPIPGSNTNTNKTTFCVYRSQSSSVSLAVRTAKNDAGVQLNRGTFSSPPTASQAVRGYGDAAFWTPGFGQLNILKHDTWYILSNGVNDPQSRTLKQTEELADQILPRL